MEKLELKHLAPYLPYQIKIKTKDGVLELDTLSVSYSWKAWFYKKTKFNTEIIARMGISGKGYFLKEIKPILRPLSDLKYYITKLDFRAENEVQFTYYDSLPNQLTITATYKLMGETYTDFIVNRNSFKNVDYWIIEKLFEWHFDVFGLIDKGLAIDANTLPK